MCDIAEPATTFWETTPTARKTYACCECGSEILPGEKYHKLTGVWDGVFATYKTCAVCQRVREAVIGVHNCVVLGQLWETEGFNFEEAGNG